MQAVEFTIDDILAQRRLSQHSRDRMSVSSVSTSDEGSSRSEGSNRVSFAELPPPYVSRTFRQRMTASKSRRLSLNNMYM
eukprot:Clim_evm24s207 gene=Clim_evmTU24s207